MNMDYCKYENTYKDFMQILDDMKPASDSEKKYAKRLFEQMLDLLLQEDVINDYDQEMLEEFIKNLE